MADVRPLPGLRYADSLLARHLAPPYDILDEAQVAELAARSATNVVRVTRPGSDYEGAGRRFEQWVAEGLVREESGPAMYLHETRFEGRHRRDLVAGLRLQDYEDRVVLPHERTHRGPKEDRLALFRATGLSLEPLWFLYQGAGTVLPGLLAAPPVHEWLEFEWEGQDHRLGVILDRAWQAAVHRAFAALPVLIADGHHRYETTLAHSREIGGGADAASRFTLALLTDLADPGLVVLPTHRILRSGIAVTGGRPVASLEQALAEIEGRVAAACYRAGAFQVFDLEGEVAAFELHRQVLDNLLGQRSAEESILYTRDAAEAVRWVDEGRGVAAFFIPTPDLAAVLRVAEAGQTMPQKTTYFFPKAPSGMVFHRLDPGRNLLA